MGRWAQRQIRGGGGLVTGPALLRRVVQVLANGGTHTSVAWDGPIDAADFDAGQWSDSNAGQIGVAVTQLSANQIDVEWSGGVSAGDDWSYTDVLSYTVTPQSGFMV